MGGMAGSMRAAGTGLALLLCAHVASAQPPRRDDRAAAEALFAEGRALMTAGHYEEACAKLKTSYELDPALGALLNLGECYERAGRIASAWATFHSALLEAQRQGRKDREAIAERRANALQPKVPYLEIVGSVPNGVRLLRNGADVDPAVVGTKVPVDPGTHTIELASSAGRLWSTKVIVKLPGSLRVELPANIGSASPPAPPGPVDNPRPKDPSRPPEAEASSSLTTNQWLGIGIGGVGLMGLGVGTFFGLRAVSLKNRADCTDTCTPSGAVTLDEAQTSGNAATISFVAGGVLTATGIALLVLGSRSSTTASAGPTIGVTFGPGQLGARGVF